MKLIIKPEQDPSGKLQKTDFCTQICMKQKCKTAWLYLIDLDSEISVRQKQQFL